MPSRGCPRDRDRRKHGGDRAYVNCADAAANDELKANRIGNANVLSAHSVVSKPAPENMKAHPMYIRTMWLPVFLKVAPTTRAMRLVPYETLKRPMISRYLAGKWNAVLCKPATKRHQSGRAKHISRPDPDDLHALDVTYDRWKRRSDRGLHMRRITLESEFLDADTTWLRVGQISE